MASISVSTTVVSASDVAARAAPANAQPLTASSRFGTSRNTSWTRGPMPNA
jgi:hypothetical protein